MALSGIPTSEALRQAFATFSAGTDRALLAHIDADAIEPLSTISANGSDMEDFALLDPYLTNDSPRYILWKSEDAAFTLVTFVPDAAPVRQKMLYSSSKAALVKDLGESNISDHYFATDKKDLTPEAYKRYLAHQAAQNPLTDAEKDQQLISQAEKLEIRETRQTAGWTSGSAFAGLPWTEEAEGAVQGFVSGSNSFVGLYIDVPKETVGLETTGTALAIPTATPLYSFYSLQGTIVFVYSCPPASPVKSRLVYSSNVHGLLAKAAQLGLKVQKKIETSEPQEITDDFIASELGLGQSPEKEAPATQGFAKPRRPGRK